MQRYLSGEKSPLKSLPLWSRLQSKKGYSEASPLECKERLSSHEHQQFSSQLSRGVIRDVRSSACKEEPMNLRCHGVRPFC